MLRALMRRSLVFSDFSVRVTFKGQFLKVSLAQVKEPLQSLAQTSGTSSLTFKGFN